MCSLQKILFQLPVLPKILPHRLINIVINVAWIRPDMQLLRKIITSACQFCPYMQLPRNIITLKIGSPRQFRPDMQLPRNIVSSPYQLRPHIQLPRNIVSSPCQCWQLPKLKHSCATSAKRTRSTRSSAFRCIAESGKLSRRRTTRLHAWNAKQSLHLVLIVESLIIQRGI